MPTCTTLHIPNWMLPEDLAEYWQQVRPQNARERRLPSSSSIEMFRFVIEKTPPGTQPKWSSLVRAWDQGHEIPLTRDKLFKVYHSVLKAFFPHHPSKQSLQFSQQRMKVMQEAARVSREKAD